MLAGSKGKDTMSMRDKIVLAMSSHDPDVRVAAAMNDFEEVDGHADHLHILHADAIMLAFTVETT